jgi:AAA+ ATPase superfamily predicted ATPase
LFINRVSELELLEKLLDSGKAEFFVLYGRRRVGKTELLSHFCREKRAIFFVADLASEESLRAGFSRAVNEVLFGPDQVNAVYPTWEDLLNALARGAQSERLVVVIDEFPYLVSAHPPIASILQRVWDQSLKNSRLMLILSGSYIGMMEETVLGYEAPLYGRRTGQYLLEPFLFRDAQAFFDGYSLEDQGRAYAVYGGTPAYLETLRTNLSLEQNILDGILTRGAFLYDEVRFVLHQELREPRNYFAILQAIAGGRTRLNEIGQAAGIGVTTSYMETLRQLHLVERRIPVTESQPHKSRRGIYRLKDPYLRFWFQFVHPNRSHLERGGGRAILESKVLPQLDTFTGLVFEEICMQFLWRAGMSGRLPFVPTAIGGWWRANEEIDLVVMGETETLLVECKWSREAVGTNVLRDLENKMQIVQPELGDRTVHYALCSRSGFTEQVLRAGQERTDLLLFDLPALMPG